MTTLDAVTLSAIVGGRRAANRRSVAGPKPDAGPYSIAIDGWDCKVGAHYPNGKGGVLDSCVDSGDGSARMPDQLWEAFRPGAKFPGIVPGIVDPAGLAGPKTTPPG